MTVQTIDRELYLINEMDLAVHLIQQGLKAVQNIPDTSFGGIEYHLPILLLSNGFERYCKCILCVNFLTDNGHLPEEALIRDYGHNISRLVNAVVNSYNEIYLPDDVKPPDIELITRDPIVLKSIEILTNYGIGGRYDNLSIALGKNRSIDDIPEIAFDSFQSLLIEKNRILATLQSDQSKHEKFIKSLDSEIIILFEKLAKILGKMIRYNSDTGREVFQLMRFFV